MIEYLILSKAVFSSNCIYAEVDHDQPFTENILQESREYELDLKYSSKSIVSHEVMFMSNLLSIDEA